MRIVLVLTLAATMACISHASTSTLAIFFDVEDQRTNSDGTNFDSEPAYLVLLNAPALGIQGFEFGMQLDVSLFGAASWTWPAGYTAYGNPPLYPQVVGPVLEPDEHDTILLGTLEAIFTSAGSISLGPKVPPDPTYPLNPVIVDHTGTVKIPAELAIHPDEIGADGIGIMATILGGGVVATEEKTLSNVKALFQ